MNRGGVLPLPYYIISASITHPQQIDIYQGNILLSNNWNNLEHDNMYIFGLGGLVVVIELAKELIVSFFMLDLK